MSVNQLRTDPFSGFKSVIAPGRSSRPGSVFVVSEPAAVSLERDPFAEGCEQMTPPELDAFAYTDDRVADTPGWSVRVVPNLYPTFSSNGGDLVAEANRDLFLAAPACGAHEVIVNGPQPVVSLGDLPLGQLRLALEMWQQRLAVHREAAYCHLIVNERPEAGASLAHTHAQLFVLDFVPAAVARERERYGAYANRLGGSNLAGDLVAEEVRRGERLVALDQDCVLVAAFAARGPFHLYVLPRRPAASFCDGGALAAGMLAEALQRLRAVFGHIPPLNIWVRTAPIGADFFCWRIELVPRLTHLAGLELGLDLGVSIATPEAVAAQLRDAG